MNPLKRHRLTLYGRIVASVLMFVVFVILGGSAVITDTMADKQIPILVLLVLSVVVLPRSPVPGSKDVRDEASDEELDHFKRVRTWLTGTRVAYLALAIGVFLGLPAIV